jgi:hypothetical protein
MAESLPTHFRDGYRSGGLNQRFLRLCSRIEIGIRKPGNQEIKKQEKRALGLLWRNRTFLSLGFLIPLV